MIPMELAMLVASWKTIFSVVLHAIAIVNGNHACQVVCKTKERVTYSLALQNASLADSEPNNWSKQTKFSRQTHRMTGWKTGTWSDVSQVVWVMLCTSSSWGPHFVGLASTHLGVHCPWSPWVLNRSSSGRTWKIKRPYSPMPSPFV